MTESRRISVALAGNPNSGKTTVFNSLTGSSQHVGNYPGVTVEKKEGRCRRGDTEFHFVDLPGTYSLSAFSPEEVIARNHVLEEPPDVVVDVVDASNLERNLYLTTQLIQLGAPLVLAFNMSDVARTRGLEFDLDLLSGLLGAPIVSMVATRNTGRDELLDAITKVASGDFHRRDIHISYGRDIDAAIEHLAQLAENHPAVPARYPRRWLAIKLLEQDEDILGRFDAPELEEAAREAATRIEHLLGSPVEDIIADRRYGFISGAVQEATRSSVEIRHTMSDKVDAVATHRVLGLPIFLALMYLLFFITFTVGEVPMDWIETGFGWLAQALTDHWPGDQDGPLLSLLVDGIIGGVGGVVVFLPNIMLLFAAIALLEDTGYMARAAFIMDQFMHRIGLHGKSFIPLVIGFGCSVPAILATRTLENRRDRLTTMLVVPLMSCGARLPIYALFIPAFFPLAWRAPILWIVYVIGVIVAVLSAKLLRMTLFRGEAEPFVMELPPYRMPTGKGIAIHTWERSWMYLKKAGTIILGISIVLWVLTSYPRKEGLDADYDAREDRVVAGFLDGVDRVAGMMGAGEKAGNLRETLRPELRGEAVERDTNGLVDDFLAMRREIDRARAAYESELEQRGVARDSLTGISLATELERVLEHLRHQDPGAYDAALFYLDEVLSPARAGLSEIAGARVAERMAHTFAGRIGHAMEPALAPLGFDWRIGTALIGAFAAKEVFVAQLGIVFAVGEDDAEGSDALRVTLRENYSPLAAFSIILFCLIGLPCMATIVATRKESGSWRWALFQLVGLTALAYIVTLVVYQAGRALGIGLA